MKILTGDPIQLDLAHKNFQNEFENLKNLKHQNIVQVFGNCYETTEGTPLEFNGRIVQTVNVHRALCMEYMHNGSLHKYLSGIRCSILVNHFHERIILLEITC